VSDGRADRAWGSINACARREGLPVSIRHVCIACVQAVAADGAGLSMARGVRLSEPVFATDPRSDQLEELQFTLGEGPSIEALSDCGVVLVTDLSSVGSAGRWPTFAAAAVRDGVRAMFSVPVQAGAARLGVLNLYRDRTGPLTGDELADALTYADAALVLALDRRGGISPRMQEFFDAEFTRRRAEVHQAAGMVTVQMGVTVTDALARLRAYAYAHDRRLADVATDVVARRLRLDPNNASARRANQVQNGNSPPGTDEQEEQGGGNR
jgi:ANTAR domain